MSKLILVFVLSLWGMGSASASVCANWLKSERTGVFPLMETDRLTLRKSYLDRSDNLQFKRLYTTPDVRREFGDEGRRYGFPDIHVHRAGIGTYFDEGTLVLETGIFNKSTGELLGVIVARHYQTRADLLKNSVGFSYSLVPEARGKGYMREALAAVMSDIRRQDSSIHFHLFISDDNTASLKLAKDFGFKKLKADHQMDKRNFGFYVQGSPDWMESLGSLLEQSELTPAE